MCVVSSVFKDVYAPHSHRSSSEDSEMWAECPLRWSRGSNTGLLLPTWWTRWNNGSYPVLKYLPCNHWLPRQLTSHFCFIIIGICSKHKLFLSAYTLYIYIFGCWLSGRPTVSNWWDFNEVYLSVDLVQIFGDQFELSWDPRYLWIVGSSSENIKVGIST